MYNYWNGNWEFIQKACARLRALNHKVSWRNLELQWIMDSLDRKLDRRCRDRAKAMCLDFTIGGDSTRPMPENDYFIVLWLTIVLWLKMNKLDEIDATDSSLSNFCNKNSISTLPQVTVLSVHVSTRLTECDERLPEDGTTEINWWYVGVHIME